jgi:hypothetical protein
MIQLHAQIHAHFLQLCEEDPEFTHAFETPPNLVTFCKAYFHNYTSSSMQLRLTHTGHAILKNMYEYWQWPITEQDRPLLNKGTTIMSLRKVMKAPYYWDMRSFYVYHSEHALEYQLVSQDFSAWLRSI